MIIINSEEDSSADANVINKIALAASKTLSGEKAINFMNLLINEDTVKLIRNGEFVIQEDEVERSMKEQDFTLGLHRHYARNVLEVEKGGKVVVCNGRVLGPLEDDEEFTSEDFALLERFSQSTYGDKLLTNLIKLQTVDDDDDYGIVAEFLFQIVF